MGRGARKRERVVPFDNEPIVIAPGVINVVPQGTRTMKRSEYKAMLNQYKRDDYAIAVIKAQIRAGELRIEND